MKPATLSYGVDDRPPLSHLMLLGLQYTCMLFPYLIIVVILSKVAAPHHPPALSAAFWALSIAILLQVFKKGPIGCGYLAPPVVSAIYFPSSLMAAHLGGLPLIYGMTVIAGGAECALAFILLKFRKWLPPLIPGLIVLAVGIELGLLAFSQAFSTQAHHPQAHLTSTAVALATLAMMIGLTLWGKGIVKLLAPFIGILFGFFLSATCHLIPQTSWDSITTSAWVALPTFSIGDYAFDVDLIIPFLIASLAGSLRTVGAITTCQKINDAHWKTTDLSNIKKGVLADGIGCSVSGLIGCPGINTSPSLIGLSQATGATSRCIAFFIAGWLIFLSFIPKFSYLFSAIPLCVMGAALLYTASFMITGGIELITSRKMTTRDILTIGLSLLLGISHETFPTFYAQIPAPLSLFTNSLLSLVTLSALALNALFLIKSKEPLLLNQQIESPDKVLELINPLSLHLPAPLVKKLSDATHLLIPLLSSRYLEEGMPSLTISQDPTEVHMQFTYKGSLPALEFSPQKERALLEDTPFTLGLSSFLTPTSADKTSCSYKDGTCLIDLIFYK